MYTKKQLVAAVLFTAIMFGGIGFYIAAPKSTIKYDNDTFQAGLDAAYQRLINSGNASVVVRGYGYKASDTIGGIIKEINPKKIILEVSPLNPLADPGLRQREVDVNEVTKIYQSKEKTIEQYEKDMEDYNKKMAELNNDSGGEMLNPPEMFTKELINFDELKVGSNITITAKKDIHDQKNIAAEEIILID